MGDTVTLTPHPQRVMLLGATGTIGRATTRALLADGHEVICLVRPGAKDLPAAADIRFGQVADPVSLRDDGFRGEGFDVLVSCLASRSGAPQDAWAIDHAANAWGPGVTASLMEQLLPDWPPEKNEEGKAYKADTRDEWRFRLGMYYALAGEQEKASGYFNEMLATPAVPDSQWVAAAKRFLETYHTPTDLYKACIEAEGCDPRRALTSLIEAIPPDEYPNALAALSEAGVSLRTTGYFDFDGDEVSESWFTVRHHAGEKLEFWIVMPSDDGIKAIFVDNLDSNRPKVSYYDEEEYPPTTLIDDSIAIRVERTPGKLNPHLVRPVLPQLYPDRFQDAVDAARIALLSGADPEKVYRDLLAIQKSPGLLCRAFWRCDEYYYLLGLAAELGKHPKEAIDAYLTLWRDYTRSPFTTMARLKLVWTGVTPTPTVTKTPTTTPIVTLTPGTPSPTTFGTPAVTTPTPTQPLGTGPAPTATLTPQTPDPNPYPIITPIYTPYP
jgi:hypothetical protein